MDTSAAENMARKCLTLDSHVLFLYKLYSKYRIPIQPVMSIEKCNRYSIIKKQVGINPLIKANADEILIPFIFFR